MSILNNAVDSIILGIEDYQSPDPRRLLSATRNLVAGILLLYKHKLASLSPVGSDEALIKQRVLPVADATGSVTWRGKGTKTVDFQQIRERCESLGISVGWKRIQKIVEHRNDIEHYFTSLIQSDIRSLIADAFILIRDFVRVQLDEDPLHLFGEATWSVLSNVAEVYNKEKKECETNINSIDWRYTQLKDALLEWQCPDCGSGLIDVKITGVDRWKSIFKCRSCGKEHDFEDGAEKAIIEFYAWQNYDSIKHGGDPATILCPNCSHETYDLDENCCILCEESVERECKRCGVDIPPEEIDGDGYCSFCAYNMAKDD
ncbi:MAG: hypothetical protein WC602_02695 [archaeon]